MKLRTRTRFPRRGARVGIAAATTLTPSSPCRPAASAAAARHPPMPTPSRSSSKAAARPSSQPIADLYKEETGTDGHARRAAVCRVSTTASRPSSASGQPHLRRRRARRDLAQRLRDGVAPLDDLYTDEVKDDLFGGLVTEAQVDGAFVGMPVWTNSEILFYRTDLFEDPTNQADFEAKYGYPLAPPTDWEEYRDVAEFFTRDTDGDGQVDLYGTDVKGAVETEWLATVSQAGEEHMVLDAESRRGDDRRRGAPGGARLLHQPAPVRPDRRRAARLGRRAEPLLPGQPRHDAVLGPRLSWHSG